MTARRDLQPVGDPHHAGERVSERGAGDPSRSLVAIGQLRAAVARLAEIEDGGGAAGRWLAIVISEYQSGARHGLRLDETVGLLPGPGREPWFVIEDRRRRDELLCSIAARFFAGEPSRRRQAAAISARLVRYQATAWLRDRPYRDPPERGTLRELLFFVLKRGPAPASRTIERALGGARQEPPAVCDAEVAADHADADDATETAG